MPRGPLFLLFCGEDQRSAALRSFRKRRRFPEIAHSACDTSTL